MDIKGIECMQPRGNVITLEYIRGVKEIFIEYVKAYATNVYLLQMREALQNETLIA